MVAPGGYNFYAIDSCAVVGTSQPHGIPAPQDGLRATQGSKAAQESQAASVARNRKREVVSQSHV